jgi:putative salt-induced outer membrane protein YdiY
MRHSVLCAFLLGSMAFAVSADQVTLKNGDRLTGSIVSGDTKTLLLKTEFAGDITVQWDAITAIESSQNLNLTLKDGKRLAGKISTTGGDFVVAGAEAPSAAVPASKNTIIAVRNDAEQTAFDTAAQKMAHPKFTYFWGGLFDTGLAMTRGNSSTISYTFNAKAVRETPRDKLTLYSTYIFANDNTASPGRTTANALRAGVRGDLNFRPRLFVFAFADYETNQLQNLDLRQVYGGGFGYHVIKTERNIFDVFGGISYDHDAFGAYSYGNPTPPPALIDVAAITQNSAEAVMGEEFDSHLSKRSMLTERFSLFPNLSHTGDYRFQFDATLSTKVKTWLSWQVTFSDRYISYPPPGLKGNDLLLSTGLRVTWGKAKL